jgi:glycosyltransferase involved in cell wall biosynthesis
MEQPSNGARPEVVSVVIPTYRRLHLLPQALDSIRAQERPGLCLQVIVPDNDCDPAVEAVVREYGGEYVATRVKGAGAVRNVALERVRGDYVAFLDDDDQWTPDHLESHVRLLRADPRLGATVSRQVLGDADAHQVEGNVAAPATGPEGTDLFPLFLSYFPSVCSVVARAGVVHEFGGFDVRLIHAEDWDWNLRLALTHPMGFVDRTTFVIRSRAWSPTETKIAWARLGYWHRVFWKHVLHSGSRRPPLGTLLNIYRRQSGLFATWLCSCAALSAKSGRRWSAAAALAKAFVASPPHAAAWLARRALGRQVAWGALDTR